MIMDQTMLEQEQASERKDLISDITESKMELKMLNQDQGNSSDPELAVYPESVQLAWQSHYDKVEASHQLVQTRPLSEYEKAGGYIGLEAGFIESKVRNATRDAGAVDVTEKQIRDLLLSLVDREKLKTVGKPASQLKVG